VGGKAKGAPPQPVETPSIALPKTHWSISYSDVFADVEGEPTEPVPHEKSGDTEPSDLNGDSDTTNALLFNYNFKRSFRTDADPTGLETLINGKISLQLHESGSGAVISSIHLDLLPFASKGDEKIELHDVQLMPLATAAEGGPKVRLAIDSERLMGIVILELILLYWQHRIG
jgi:hypothetical protein